MGWDWGLLYLSLRLFACHHSLAIDLPQPPFFKYTYLNTHNNSIGQ